MEPQRSLTRGRTARRLAMLAVLTVLSVAASVGVVGLRSARAPALLAAPPAAGAEVPAIPPRHGFPRTPASVSHTHPVSPGLGVLADPEVAPVDAVPSRAYAAYDRAAVVMRSADASCHLGWELIAAVGQVESNHGRFGGRLMTADGMVHPALYGPRLDGSSAFARIDDTDAGRLDGDPRFDRAVGPMQFIPSTWMVVGVDGDADGRRDPQDIDDAALATAVYLCSGRDDLATTVGQRRAVHRYNHSSSYVDLVLRLMNGYLETGPGSGGLLSTVPLLPPPTGSRGPAGQPTPPTGEPTFDVVPSSPPTITPTTTPTTKPTATVWEVPVPSATATVTPTPTPSQTPPPRTAEPTLSPSAEASPSTPAVTAAPSPPLPTETPLETPTETPTESATPTPTEPGSPTPTIAPSETATPQPSEVPTTQPSEAPPAPPPAAGDERVPVAWQECVDSGVDPVDPALMATCVLERVPLPADDPDLTVLMALLAQPPVTPPE